MIGCAKCSASAGRERVYTYLPADLMDSVVSCALMFRVRGKDCKRCRLDPYSSVLFVSTLPARWIINIALVSCLKMKIRWLKKSVCISRIQNQHWAIEWTVWENNRLKGTDRSFCIILIRGGLPPYFLMEGFRAKNNVRPKQAPCELFGGDNDRRNSESAESIHFSEVIVAGKVRLAIIFNKVYSA